MNENAIKLFGSDGFSYQESQYFGLVDRACRRSLDLPISNSLPKHAVYLIYTLLSNANRTVRLLTGTLSRVEDGVDVYGNKVLAEAACSLLNRPDSCLRIALRDGLDADGAHEHPFVRTVLDRQNLKGRLELRRCEEGIVESMKGTGLGMHWMTMDERAFRLEYDTREIKAYANFGESHMTRHLNEIFDDIFFNPGRDLLASEAAG